MELSKIEKLAVMQAFQKVIGSEIKTGDPSNLRGEVDAKMREAYESNPMAAKSYDVNVLGRKVGTYSLTISKPRESTTRTELDVDDYGALWEWAETNGCLMVDKDAVMEVFEQTGEIPEGCSVREVVEPGTVGGEVVKSTLKIDAEQVARALGPQLEPVAQLLLEGGLDG